jgi:hypothetical protein
MISPTIYTHVSQLCFFNGFASSGQLGMRLTAVLHVFRCVVEGAVVGSDEYSTTSPREALRRSFEKSVMVDNADLGGTEAHERRDEASSSQRANTSFWLAEANAAQSGQLHSEMLLLLYCEERG